MYLLHAAPFGGLCVVKTVACWLSYLLTMKIKIHSEDIEDIKQWPFVHLTLPWWMIFFFKAPCIHRHAWLFIEATEAVASGLCLGDPWNVSIEIYNFLLEVSFAEEKTPWYPCKSEASVGLDTFSVKRVSKFAGNVKTGCPNCSLTTMYNAFTCKWQIKQGAQI